MRYNAVDPFDVYIFCELDPERAAVLADRVDETGLLRRRATTLGADQLFRNPLTTKEVRLIGIAGRLSPVRRHDP